MQKLVPNTLPNRLILHTTVTHNQGKRLKLLQPVHYQYLTIKVKLMLKNEKSHHITILALSQICHYIATNFHKNITTRSYAPQPLVPPEKVSHQCYN